MEHFAQLVTREYALIGALAAGLMDLERLKKFLSNGEGDHVSESENGGESVMDDGGRKEATGDSGDGKKIATEGEQAGGGGQDAGEGGDSLKGGVAIGGKDDEEKVLEPDDVLV